MDKDKVLYASIGLLFAVMGWFGTEFIILRDKSQKMEGYQIMLITPNGEVRTSNLVLTERQRNNEQDRRIKSLEEQILKKCYTGK